MFHLAFAQVTITVTCLISFKLNQSAIFYISPSNSSRKRVTKITTIATKVARLCPHLLSRSYLPLQGQSK